MRVRSTLTALMAAMPVMVAANEAEIRVERVMIASPDPRGSDTEPHTIIDLWVSMPDVAGLGDDARVTRLSDDAGNDLLGDETGSSEGDPGAATGSDSLMRHQMTLNAEEDWLRFSVYAPSAPSRAANELNLMLDLDLQIIDGSRTVTLEGVDLSEIPGWGVELDVEGQTLNCKDERRERPDDQPLELYCVMRDGVLLGVHAPDNEGDAELTYPRANLLLEGDRQDVTLDVELPVTRDMRFDVDLDFGLGLSETHLVIAE